MRRANAEQSLRIWTRGISLKIVGRCISWLGFIYLTIASLAALYLLIQLNLDFVQTLVYLVATAIVAGLPYLILALLHRFVAGSFGWLPWRLT